MPLNTKVSKWPDAGKQVESMLLPKWLMGDIPEITLWATTRGSAS